MKVTASRRADIGYVAAVLVGVALLFMLGIAQLRIDKLGTDDFSMIWAGPRAFFTGLDPYDVATWPQTAVRVGAHALDTDVYPYPPWVILALAPFALVSPGAAGVIWSLAGMVIATIALRALLRAYLPGVAWAHAVIGTLVVLSPAAVVTLLLGQWTFVLLASLAAVVVLLRRHRYVLAGLVATVMIAKPPLFVFSAAGLAVRALWPGAAVERRFVISAIGGTLAIVGFSWILIPSWWPAWLRYSVGALVDITPVTLPTLFTTLFGPDGIWLAPPVLLGCALLGVQFHPRGDGWLPVWFALSTVGVIYSNTYDLLLLIVPLVLAGGALMRHHPRRAAFVLVTGALLLFAAMWYLHTTYVRGYAAGVSLLVFALITASLWPERRRSDSDGIRASGASAQGTVGSSRR